MLSAGTDSNNDIIQFILIFILVMILIKVFA